MAEQCLVHFWSKERRETGWFKFSNSSAPNVKLHQTTNSPLSFLFTSTYSVPSLFQSISSSSRLHLLCQLLSSFPATISSNSIFLFTMYSRLGLILLAVAPCLINTKPAVYEHGVGTGSDRSNGIYQSFGVSLLKNTEVSCETCTPAGKMGRAIRFQC